MPSDNTPQEDEDGLRREVTRTEMSKSVQKNGKRQMTTFSSIYLARWTERNKFHVKNEVLWHIKNIKKTEYGQFEQNNLERYKTERTDAS